MLLHARCGPSGSRLVNGTTATVTARRRRPGSPCVLDGSGEEALLPAGFVQGTRKDGSPNLSHAWARTVDGAQGGTWEACHLLGSAALDAYRGYTGQSRSRQPTHTWNTTQLAAVDHGGDPGRPARRGRSRSPRRWPANPIPPWPPAATPGPSTGNWPTRSPNTSGCSPAGPPTPTRPWPPRAKELAPAEAWLANMDAVAAYSASQLDSYGTLAGLSRRGRQERRDLQDKLTVDRQQAQDAKDRRDEIAGRVAALQRDTDDLERFERAEGWRRDDIRRLHDQLDDHWARVVAACVRADDPLAFGIDKLRHARATTAARVNQLDAQVPPDRGDEWQQLRRQLPDLLRARHHAEQALTAGQANLDDASRRRWGRHDHEAIAAAKAKVAFSEQRLEQAVTAERDLRDELAAIAGHQQQRKQVINDSAPRRNELASTVAQLDAALDHTRPERVHALADEPPAHQVERLGEPPAQPPGEPCGAITPYPSKPSSTATTVSARLGPDGSGQTDRAKKEIAVADRHLKATEGVNPSEWAEPRNRPAPSAMAWVRDERIRQAAGQTRSSAPQAEHHLRIDHSQCAPPAPKSAYERRPLVRHKGASRCLPAAE